MQHGTARRRRGNAALSAVRGKVALALALALAVTGGTWAASPAVAHNDDHGGRNKLAISVLSSAPDQVSGGDALIRVDVPRSVSLHKVKITSNGTNVTDRFSRADDGRALVGIVDGLVLGPNRLRATTNEHGRGRDRAASLKLVNHPISGPIFSGPQQQPFVCATARATHDGRRLLGQPLVDNQDSFGIPVAAEDASGNYPSDGRGYPTAAASIVGWSKDCATPTRIDYVYKTTDGAFRWLDDPASLPADVASTTTLDGQTVPYVVRWERGTINRFIYSIAMLAPTTETDPTDPDDSLWNGRLVLSLQGGVAIGYHQGTTSASAMLLEPVLGLGYAVINSTGLRTNTHYNLQLGGETALMQKEHFIEDHGVPYYTVGVGGSGGAIQQYVYGQNHPGLLDAAIPQYSYPDMVTQTIHVGDCELLEHYFDVAGRDNPKWRDPEMRQAIMGLNASNFPQNLSSGDISQWNGLYGLYQLLGYPLQDPDPASPLITGLTECRASWFGLTPLTLNPTFTNVQDLDKLAQGSAGVEWTHWADLVNIYGVDDTGFARRPWDNVGVQYGLEALRDGLITPDEFFHLNATVGGWKHPSEMVTEGFPFVGAPSPATFDPWSSRQMNLSPDGGATPAPRTEGDLAAMHAAYESGMVFDGDIDIPIIDWRHYLEDELDMHHSHQSFAARQRMVDHGGAGNQVIWFTDARPAVAFDQTPLAFEVIDEWMRNIKAHPWRSVAKNRPARAVDSCFATDGSLLHSGKNVWAGVLDDRAPGACTELFEINSSTRRVAGGPYRGGVFKCQLQPVGEAIAAGLYGSWQPDAAERARLEEVFPTGVCDFSRPDAGRPTKRWGHS